MADGRIISPFEVRGQGDQVSELKLVKQPLRVLRDHTAISVLCFYKCALFSRIRNTMAKGKKNSRSTTAKTSTQKKQGKEIINSSGKYALEKKRLDELESDIIIEKLRELEDEMNSIVAELEKSQMITSETLKQVVNL
jgi:hypothetical protein